MNRCVYIATPIIHMQIRPDSMGMIKKNASECIRLFRPFACLCTIVLHESSKTMLIAADSNCRVSYCAQYVELMPSRAFLSMTSSHRRSSFLTYFLRVSSLIELSLIITKVVDTSSIQSLQRRNYCALEKAECNTYKFGNFLLVFINVTLFLFIIFFREVQN